MELLKQYIIALTNLYGIVAIEQVAEIYNQQNEDRVNDDDVADYLDEDLSTSHVYDYDEHFVHESVIEVDEFDALMDKKGDKPHYIPEKDELLKYADARYYEKPKQYHDLFKYVKRSFLPSDAGKAEMLCDIVIGTCRSDFDIQKVFHYFGVFGIEFKNETQINEVLQMVMELANNVRLWENNGHTPHEIFEKFEKPNLRPLPAAGLPGIAGEPKLSVMHGGASEKAGRNDPCPCGSGKKYKKCCIDKERGN